MSGASDKARFYLEQSVPQLQEFKEKKIFSEDEIRNLVKRRSDFEHKILGRGSRPIDFAQYAVWEISLERLRQKRCKRLRIKGSLTHTGQARIFNIFDRALRKHPGDVALWMSYLDYVRQAKAMKKFKAVLTSAIRLHPTKPELWLYAARWTLETEADMNGARSYMQRGTRFCTKSKELWIEYAKLEMIYLAKISMRRKILGLDIEKSILASANIEETADDPGFADSEDVITIPDLNAHMLRPSMIEGVKVDFEAAKDPMTTPALNGAIPLAIFDAARKQPFFSPAAAEDFFDMFASFTQVRCLPKILDHVLNSMMESYPGDSCVCSCYIRQPLLGMEQTSPDFPMAVGSALDRLKDTLASANDKAELSKKIKTWLERILGLEELDPGIETVLRYTIRKLD